jgi:hypothetical protein
MAKGRKPVDDLLDALVWMRRKARKHEPVDEIIDVLVKMRRDAQKEAGEAQSQEASALEVSTDSTQITPEMNWSTIRQFNITD